MSEPTIKYLGKQGDYIDGIPARSLSSDDYAALDVDQRATVRKSGLYDYASYKDATASSTPAADAPPQAEQAIATDVPPSDVPAEAAPVEPTPDIQA